MEALTGVIVRSKLIPAPRPEIFGFAELSPVTEEKIAFEPRLTIVWLRRREARARNSTQENRDFMILRQGEE